jgi:hypothetical protein
MEMPPVHMCAYLNHENERLKSKIIELKRQRSHLERLVKDNNHEHIRSCSISCQTDLDLVDHHHRISLPSMNKITRSSSDDRSRLYCLLHDQNERLKTYQTNKANEQRQQRSSTSIADYERRLKSFQEEKQKAEQRASTAEQRLAKFEQRYERMRKELSVLDDRFFDDIEDLKYALQQATILNREYEKTVQMLTRRLNIAVDSRT